MRVFPMFFSVISMYQATIPDSNHSLTTRSPARGVEVSSRYQRSFLNLNLEKPNPSVTVIDLASENFGKLNDDDQIAFYYSEDYPADPTPTVPPVTASEFQKNFQPKQHDYKTSPPIMYGSGPIDMENEYSAEQKLYEQLLGSNSGYLKSVRPTKKYHEAINVEVGMSVMMIEELVERDQLMVMSAAIKMKWHDRFLSWDPTVFDNLTWLAVSSAEIWTPDISIVNSPNPFELTRKVATVDVDHFGEVGYFPSGHLMTRCNIHVQFFPFDSQHCEVLMESWIYPTNFLKFVPYEDGNVVDIKEYYTNHQWSLTGFAVNYENASYDNKNFSQITFTFVLKRKSQYYFMYFIFPQFLLACLQTLSHTLPVEHPGRMTMLTSLFIGTSVTQAGVANSIPKSSDAQSLLQIYMTIMSVNLVLALVISTVILYVVLRYPDEEPSLHAIVVALFSITWPEIHCPEDVEVASPVYANRKCFDPAAVETYANSYASEEHATSDYSDEGEDTGYVARPQVSSSSTSSAERGTRRRTFVADTYPRNQRDRRMPRLMKMMVSSRNSKSAYLKKPYGIHVTQGSIQLRDPPLYSDGYGRRRSLRNRRNSEWDINMGYVTTSRRNSGAPGERGELKRDPVQEDLEEVWLLYCVALDKTIMYIQMAWNIVLPIVLFAIIPRYYGRITETIDENGHNRQD